MSEVTPVQNFENHSKIPILYALSGLVLLVYTGYSAYDAYLSRYFSTYLNVAVGLALLVIWRFTRTYATKVQDRIIRLEMRLRLERVLPKERHADIDRLSVSHLIGLRFASDAELPGLIDNVLSGTLKTAKEIKRSVKNWQPDTLRV